MDEYKFNNLVQFVQLVRVDGLENAYHALGNFYALVREDDYECYESLSTLPPYSEMISVTIKSGVLYIYIEPKNTKPLGTFRVYYSMDIWHREFVDYETMLMTAWQPPNEKQKVIIPSLYGDFYK
jgi:hypothetical protein